MLIQQWLQNKTWIWGEKHTMMNYVSLQSYPSFKIPNIYKNTACYCRNNFIPNIYLTCLPLNKLWMKIMLLVWLSSSVLQRELLKTENPITTKLDFAESPSTAKKDLMRLSLLEKKTDFSPKGLTWGDCSSLPKSTEISLKCAGLNIYYFFSSCLRETHEAGRQKNIRKSRQGFVGSRGNVSTHPMFWYALSQGWPQVLIKKANLYFLPQILNSQFQKCQKIY